MKIGFLARTTMLMERYYKELYNQADCWWGVTSMQLNDELKEKGYLKTVFHQDKSIINKKKILVTSMFLSTLEKVKIKLPI